MKRALLAAAFLTVGISLLLWTTDGARGPGAREPDPEFEAVAPEVLESPELVRPMNLPLSVDVVEGYSQAARPESLTFVDPRTGERVVVPAFERWHFVAKSGKPVEARRSGRQAVLLEDVEVLTFREPQTLVEAHAVERGERLLKWRVTAPTARVDDLALQSLDEQPGGPETVVQLERRGPHLRPGEGPGDPGRVPRGAAIPRPGAGDRPFRRPARGVRAHGERLGAGSGRRTARPS